MRMNVAVSNTNIADVVGRCFSAVSKPAGIGVAAALGLLAQNASASDFRKTAELSPIFDIPEEPAPILDFPDEPVRRMELPSLNIQTNQVLTERDFPLSLSSPLRSFDANTNAWFSACQLGGKISDSIFGEDPIARATHTVLSGWWNWGMSYVSHEMGHDYLGLWNGNKHPFDFDFGDWTMFFPRFIQEPDKFEAYDPEVLRGTQLDEWIAATRAISHTPVTLDEEVFWTAAGLCQNEFDASLANRIRTLRGSFLPDQAWSHLITKFADSFYGVMFEEEGDPLEYIRSVGRHAAVNVATPTGTYQDIHYSLADFRTYALIADLLSASTWESLGSILGYVLSGKRSSEPVRLNLSGIEVYPPDFRMFPSIDGFYIDAEIPIGFPDDRKLFINLGSGVDNLGNEGRGRWIRFGAQFYRLKLGHGDGFWMEFSPFMYLDVDNRGNYKGHQVGIEGVMNFGERFSLHGTLDHCTNDMIENRIKSGEDGLRFRAGLSFRY